MDFGRLTVALGRGSCREESARYFNHHFESCRDSLLARCFSTNVAEMESLVVDPLRICSSNMDQPNLFIAFSRPSEASNGDGKIRATFS
jgi:hypothetical protein